ncbi:MAG: FAD-binding protein [Saprospiraceae bacterium]|nr:FAD-binding protein [Saprospiraceae bacterium]
MNQSLFIADLHLHCRGQVLSDEASLFSYATDASMYQIKPIVIMIPMDEDDVITAVKIAHDHQVPVIARGGGTGLAGQAIGQGMIIDFSVHLKNIISFNEAEHWAIVQPGIIRDTLNRFLAPHGLHFAPDPATSSRANVGGMIANNSSGTKSLIYGKTIDHVLEIKLLLEDGTILLLKNTTPQQYQDMTLQSNREGEIYRSFKKIVLDHKTEIQSRFPKVMRRVGGYNLDEFLTDEWNLAKLIVGSEGTLGIILQAKINLTPLPKSRYVCLSHFSNMIAAIKAVPKIVSYHPAAVEIIDRTVIEMSRQNIATRDSCHVISGHPEAVLVVEFHGEDPTDAKLQAQQLAEDLTEARIGYDHPVFPEGKAYNDILTVRKKGLGLMIGMKSQRKPVAFIEDAAIPLEHLAEYIVEVDQICSKYGVDAIKYAHASVGVIHIRPVLNLRDPGDIELLKKIAEETFLLVKKYGGSWSGEHGDGLVRSPFNERFFGSRLYQAFKDVKDLFDPNHLMNPGKIVDAPAMDQNLRYGPDYRDQPLNTVYHFREAGSFADEVHMCSGVGECRKTEKGTMCPTYMALLEEEHSTRGRANLLRLGMSGQLGKKGLLADEVLEVLDLCLSCKACKSECPSNVDMSKLKSEVWQMRYDQSGMTIRDRFIRDSSEIARFLSGSLAPLINSVQKSTVFRGTLEKMAKIDRRRILPTYAKTKFTRWYKKNYFPPKDIHDQAILFVDTYLNHHEPNVGISTVNLLTHLGIEVHIAEVGCCQRPRISNGFLHLAKKNGQKVIEKLSQFSDTTKPILVCEPSCASALQYDLPDLMDDPSLAQTVGQRISTVSDYLINFLKHHSAVLPKIKTQIYLHGHCHEKSLYGTQSTKEILSLCGASIHEFNSGCCGMAGAFGYEKEHYELSEKIGRSRLFDEIEKLPKDVILIADGFSCRHQIEHFTGRKAKFWTEVF